MTLSTQVYILDPVDPDEVFRLCQTLLGLYDEKRRGPDEQESVAYPRGRWMRETEVSRTDQVFPGREWTSVRTGERCVWAVETPDVWSRNNEPGQGLPAWLLSSYRLDGPLLAVAPGHDDDCDDDCSGSCHERACYMSLDFDTTYGYRDHRGWQCGDLHAALVGHLGAWLDTKGVRWEWRNEFTGEVHTGHDGLAELGRDGAEAARWFATEALPAILAHAATEQR